MYANDTDQLIGKKVKVYYNLHRKQWSIQDYKTRRVIGHTDYLKLSGVEFKVSQKGRERVIREKKKNVHAFAIGTIEDYNAPLADIKCVTIAYNPYKHTSFVTRYHQLPVYHASMAWFIDNTVYANNPFVTP